MSWLRDTQFLGGEMPNETDKPGEADGGAAMPDENIEFSGVGDSTSEPDGPEQRGAGDILQLDDPLPRKVDAGNSGSMQDLPATTGESAPAEKGESEAASTQLVPTLGSMGATSVALRSAEAGAASLAAQQLAPVLTGAAAGAPVRIETLSDRRLTLRVTASIWARPEIVTERKTGCAPTGPVEESAEAAAGALRPLAESELAKGRGLQTLRANLTTDPWTALAGLQGDDLGPVLAESRSVVSRCPDCAGAGGFACVDCSGLGRRVCSSCAGGGQVDQGCPSCRRAASGLDSGKTALDPKKAWTFLMDQVSSGGSAGEAAQNSVATATDRVVGRRDCGDCHGAGKMRVDCANCAGAGERRCQSCTGTGRVVCTPCEGTGFLTDIYTGRARFERSLHLALSTGESQSPPQEAIDAIRVSWDELVARRVFEPRLVGFQSSGFAAQAVFEAEIPLSRLRATIGARSPRLTMEFWAAGDPATLLAPPKALDTLHRRAVDRARVSTREGRRQIASALSDLTCGRAALRAAARRERELPSGAFGPLASDGENARLLELARASHGSVGWREERQVWSAAALLAAPAGWLAAQGLSAPAEIAVAPIAAAFAPSPSAAEIGASWWETLGAVWALLIAAAPFAMLWLLAGSAAAWIYRRATKRTLGFARTRSAARVFLGGAPLVALSAALVFYLFGLTLGAPGAHRGGAEPPGGPVQVAAVSRSQDAQASTPPQPRPRPAEVAAADSADGEGSGVTVLGFDLSAGDKSASLQAVDREWRRVGRVAAIRSRDGRAVLAARCEASGATFRLEEADGARIWSQRGTLNVDWSTERNQLRIRSLSMREDDSGQAAPEWRASFGAIRALRRDGELTVTWSAAGDQARRVFRLNGSSRAIGEILKGC